MEKSKAEILAEREAKRQAKKSGKKPQQQKKGQAPASGQCVKQQDAKVGQKTESHIVCQAPSYETRQPFTLLSHLIKYSLATTTKLPPLATHTAVHPAIVKLAIQNAERIVVGSDARCVALLAAVKELLNSLEVTDSDDSDELLRKFESSLKTCMDFLEQFRVPSVSMANAVTHVKTRIAFWQTKQLKSCRSVEETKTSLCADIDKFVKEYVVSASSRISAILANSVLNDGDVILTYGFSHILLEAIRLWTVESANAFSHLELVVLFDSASDVANSAKMVDMCSEIVSDSLLVTPADIAASPHWTAEVASKVVVEADAVLANGSVVGSVGLGQIGVIAKASERQFVVLCQTYKFSDAVQTDSFTVNELDRDDCLIYDVTPADLVDTVLTEISTVAPSTVPVVLRLRSGEKT